MNIQRKHWPLWILVFAMFFAWTAWGMVLNKTSPIASPDIAIPLFYLTSFLAVMMTFTTFSAFFRLAFLPKKTLAKHIHCSIRQGIIFGLVSMGLLIFQQFQILDALIALMIVIMGVLVEAFFWGRQQQ